MRITISCRMNFDDYPLDAHTCHFQVGSCNIYLLSDLHIEKINLDYDTHETVTCSSFFIYDLERQRNLQHFIKIEELPTEFRILKLPSGEFHFVTADTLPDKERAFKNLLSWLDSRKEIKLYICRGSIIS